MLENSTLNALSKLGTSPNAMKVIQASNADKVKPKDIATLHQNAKTGDIAKLPYNLILSADIYSLLMMDTNTAQKDNKQALTYFYLCDQDFLPPWLPPEAVGGVAHHITEEFKLATDPTKKDAMTWMNSINKTFNKTRFFRKKEHWLIIWRRVLPIILASGQWTLVAWMVHADHICRLYEYYKSSNKGSELLVTLYEDRIRHHWHRICELGQKVDLEVEAGKTHENIMDECRTRLEPTLLQCGLRENGQPQAAPQPKDDPAAALLKQQAGMDFDRKRQANEMNAFKQRQAAHLRKVNALKNSTDQQPKQQFVKSKFGKGGKNSCKGHGKGTANHQYKKQHQSYVVDGKYKGKHNGQWTKKW